MWSFLEQILIDRFGRLEFDDSGGKIVTEPVFGECCHAQLQLNAGTLTGIYPRVLTIGSTQFQSYSILQAYECTRLGVLCVFCAFLPPWQRAISASKIYLPFTIPWI
jgi:hypothetical protein